MIISHQLYTLFCVPWAPWEYKRDLWSMVLQQRNSLTSTSTDTGFLVQSHHCRLHFTTLSCAFWLRLLMAKFFLSLSIFLSLSFTIPVWWFGIIKIHLGVQCELSKHTKQFDCLWLHYSICIRISFSVWFFSLFIFLSLFFC